jgi:hypothetical protein
MHALLPALLAQAATGPKNPLTWILSAVDRFNAAHADQFLSIGSNLYTSFALIIIVWVGIQIALSGNFNANQVARLVLILAFGKALIVYYSGGDYSITQLVLRQSRFLSDRLDTNAVNLLGQPVVRALASLQMISPSITNLADAGWYFLALSAYLTLQIVAAFVICFGDVAVSVCVLLGPVFVPFFIVPKLDWLFWGWFRALLQFAFYRVVASAVLLIIADAAEAMIRNLPTAPTGGGATSGFEFLPTVLFAVVATFVILRVPMLTSNIFSGAAGSDGGIVGVMQHAVQGSVRAGLAAGGSA